MGTMSFATLRLGKTSVEDIKMLDSMQSGVLTTPYSIAVTCTQVPNDLNPGTFVVIWLGSDNSKGIPTAWKQGFKAVGRVTKIDRGEKYNDESTTTVDILYVFKAAVNRLDILKNAPAEYYWCSSLPIIGLDDHSNQTIRLLSADGPCSDIGAFFTALDLAQSGIEADLISTNPEFKDYFGFKCPDAKTDNVSSPPVFCTRITSVFSRNRILFGAPGTGKSYKLNADKDRLLVSDASVFERVTFHPEYSYSQFVGCYKPITDSAGNIRYEFVPGPFMRVLVAALKNGLTDAPQPHLLLIEEINRARVAAVFGEVFQLLDRNDDGYSQYEIHATEDVKQYLAGQFGTDPSNFSSIRIPDNMFIWATMNSADQGVFPMDTAFKRRWDFEYIGIDDNDASVGGLVEIGKDAHKQLIDWNVLRKSINEKLAVEFHVNEDKLMGPFFLGKSVFDYDTDTKQMKNPDAFKKAFKSKVLMYLYEDAAKPCKHQLFSGCDSSRYSSVCTAFDETGLEIFGADFQALYDRIKGA